MNNLLSKLNLVILAASSAIFSLWGQEATETVAPQAEASAETVVAAAAQEVAASSISIKQVVLEGGPLMYPILALSLLAVGLVIFYLLTLRPEVLFPKKDLAELDDAAEAGDLEKMRQLCQNPSSALAVIFNNVLKQSNNGIISKEILREAVEEEGGYQAGILWQRIQYLMDIAVIAPMLGLLGTVWGMMVSFSGMEGGVNFANKAATLASGVSQAMFTTFGGLIIGILAMAFYAIFRGRVNRLVNELEGTCAALVRKLSAKI